MRGSCLILCFLLGSAIVHADDILPPVAEDPSLPQVFEFDPIPAVTPQESPLISPDAGGSSDLQPVVPKASEQPSLSTVDTPPDAMVDLRPPEIALDMPWSDVEPSWLNDVIDDHLLLWQNVTDSLQTVPRAGTDFGITTLGMKFDLTGDQGPWWVSGFFGWNFLSGPTTAVVDSQTYDLGVELNYSRRLNDQWGVQMTVAPLFAGDFENKTSDAFRLTAGGLVTYQADEVTKLVAGLSYLDRPDLPFIPIAGLKWIVTENVHLDILVPNPKLAWRYTQDEGREGWLYTAGEIGGGSWAIERENNTPDRLGYRDLRWVCGVESRQVSGSRRVLEAGYVFDRKLDLYRGTGSERLGSSFVVRWGRLY